MNELELAQMIANEIDTMEEDQIEAMILITSKTHNVDLRTLTRNVQNSYYLMNRGKTQVNTMQHESDPR